MMSLFSKDKDKLQKAEAELDDLRQRWALLDRECGIGLWECVLDNGDTASKASRWTWSAELARLLGFTPAEFPNVLESWSDKVHPDDASRVFGTFGEFLADRSGRMKYNIDYRIRTKSGAYRWVNATGGPCATQTGWRSERSVRSRTSMIGRSPRIETPSAISPSMRSSVRWRGR